MSKKRRPNSAHARMVRYSRAMLRSNHVAVVDLEANDFQTLINWKNASLITTNARYALVDAVCDIPHHWTVFIAGICRNQLGEQYIKPTEVALPNANLAKNLGDVIQTYSDEQRAKCPPHHLIGMAWIATPYDLTLDEAHAYRVFETLGAWRASIAA